MARRKKTDNNQQMPLSTEELKTAAGFLMAAAQAHQRAAVLCKNQASTPPDIDSLFLGVLVAFELALLSVEQSLRLLLLLHCSVIYRSQAHDPHAIYKRLKSETHNKSVIRQEIISLMNSAAQPLSIDHFSEDEVETCLKRHRLSYSNLRYFGLTTQLRTKNWGVAPREQQVVQCLAWALISLNGNKMEARNIGAFQSVSQIPELEMTPQQKALRDHLLGRAK